MAQIWHIFSFFTVDTAQEDTAQDIVKHYNILNLINLLSVVDVFYMIYFISYNDIFL